MGTIYVKIMSYISYVREQAVEESVFNQIVDDTLYGIEEAIEDTGVDIDYDTIAGILTLEFSDQSKIIINRQVAMLQLWVAARSGGFHLDYIDSQWYCNVECCSLSKLLDRLCSDQAKTKISLGLD